MTPTPPKTLRIGHSPDPDDAFMWYPLADLGDGPKVKTGTYRFEHVLEDIESLNQRATRGELEITAMSIHQYPFIADRYALTSCGASMGDGYGPMLVAREEINLRQLITPVDTPDPKLEAAPPVDALKVAIPGVRTSAWLAFQLFMLEREGVQPGADRAINHATTPFDQIIPKVVSGEADAGLIIHEGQLTYAEAGLVKLVDLGQWWLQTRGLPLPLGGNAIRRDLMDEAPAICRTLYDSIRYALDHREEAVAYALNYARDMGEDLADRFVGMYVNELTLDYGQRGRDAVRQFLDEAAKAGLTPDVGSVDFVAPA